MRRKDTLDGFQTTINQPRQRISRLANIGRLPTVAFPMHKGELDLRTRESILKGGKFGPAMVPGKPQESLLLKRIHADEMQPGDQLIIAGVKPISGDEIKKISNWIRLAQRLRR